MMTTEEWDDKPTGSGDGRDTSKTAKGNTQPEEVWVTFWDIYDGQRTYLGEVSEEPWRASYDAPITGYADNVRYVPASMLEVVQAERDAARAELARMTAAAQDVDHFMRGDAAYERSGYGPKLRAALTTQEPKP